MLGIVLLLVFLALIIYAATGHTYHRNDVRAFPYYALVAMVGCVGLLITLAVCCTVIVPTGNVGILRQFGVIRPGVTLYPGFHMKQIQDKVETYNVQPQVDKAWNITDADGKSTNNADSVLTADGVYTTVNVSWLWNENPARVVELRTRFNDQGTDQYKAYTDAASVIEGRAVTDVFKRTSWKDGSVLDRATLEPALMGALHNETASYFSGLGFSNPSSMIQWDTVKLDLIDPPSDLSDVNTKMLVADARANANAKLVKLPPGLSADDYAKILGATAVQDAARNGKPVAFVVGR